MDTRSIGSPRGTPAGPEARADGRAALDDHLRLVAAYLAAADEQRQADGRDLLTPLLAADGEAARERALAFLPQPFWERLLGLARVAARRVARYAGADDLDDLAQTSLFKFLRAVKGGRFKGGCLDAFVRAIARHTAADFLRAGQAQHEVSSAEAALLAVLDPDRQAAEEDRRRRRDDFLGAAAAFVAGLRGRPGLALGAWWAAFRGWDGRRRLSREAVSRTAYARLREADPGWSYAAMRIALHRGLRRLKEHLDKHARTVD
jgi:DNA-directed RNA polymerase specialized sigma24 family protein